MPRPGAEIPPHDLDFEKAALGAAFHDPTAARAIAEADGDLFWHEGHRALHRVLKRLAPSINGTPPDFALVKSLLAEEPGGGDVGQLALIFEAGVNVLEVKPLIPRLAEVAAQREEFVVEMMLHEAHVRGRAARDPSLWRVVQERLARAQELRDAGAGGGRPESAALEAHALLAANFPEAPGIVGGGVLPRGGIAVFGGAPKRSKSIGALNLAIARATGNCWLGFPTSPGRTLIVQAEITPPALQERLRLMLEGLAVPLPQGALFLKTTRSLRLDEPDGLGRLRRLIEAAEPDLLILDPLARFTGGDENSTRDMGRIVAALDSLVEAYGLTILLVHHTKKPGEVERSGGERLRGSGALFAAVDSALLLDKVDGDMLRLTMELRHGPEREPRLLKRTESLWLLPAGPPRELIEAAGLVATLPMRWGLFVKAIEQDLEKPNRTAQRLLSQARDAGLVALNEDKLYAATAIYRHAMSGGKRNSDE